MSVDLSLPPDLLRRYLDGQASEEEARRVEAWYASFEDRPGITEALTPEEKEAAAAGSFRSLLGRL
ncbi:MAG TPA: hypothetical protein VHK69_01220 [Chitinophagaceae bacterium]|jgi:anti-sigma factor RsiW|nr:hypothetical protein [Chitinophagaceae bacterium]